MLAAERRLQGAMGNAPHELSCAAGYNIRWLVRAIVGLGLVGLFYAFWAVVACLACLLQARSTRTALMASARIPQRRPSTRLPWSPQVALGVNS